MAMFLHLHLYFLRKFKSENITMLLLKLDQSYTVQALGLAAVTCGLRKCVFF
jgi:hypothetical protein